MTHFIIRGTRAAAVAALLAAAFGTAHATDWNSLNSSGGWNADASAGAQSGDQQASADASATGNYGAKIATAFTSLGMEPARAECYGGVLSQKLSPEDQAEAAEIVSSASSGKDVRLAVLDAGPDIVGGFSAADVTCPKGMGG